MAYPRRRAPLRKRRVVRKRRVAAPMYKAVKSIVKQTMPAKQIRFLAQSTTMQTAAAISAGTSFLISNLSDIVQGDQTNQRERDSIFVKGVALRVVLSHGGSKCRGMRILIVRPCSVTVPFDTSALNNIMEDETYATQPYDRATDSLLYPPNRDVLQVYYDKVHKMIPETLSQGDNRFNVYVKPKCLIRYNDPSGSSTAPMNGPLYMIAFVAEYDAVVTADLTTANIMSTVYFSDSFNGRLRKRW